MVQKLTVQGTKIAQAAKDLNVTTVTIRRYVVEFDIKTATDENGIKVLPPKAMEELSVVRQLKEEGLSNAAVLDVLAKKRKSSVVSEADYMDRNEKITDTAIEETDNLNVEETKGAATSTDNKNVDNQHEHEHEHDLDHDESNEEEKADNKPKHSLTCQTCGKAFEHSNPRLRDCLDCYRSKRKERRRGGNKHRNVILHPLAQQVVNKSAMQEADSNGAIDETEMLSRHGDLGNGKTISSEAEHENSKGPGPAPVIHRGPTPVRNYRKAIDETRQITSSLKRRLERPDLPEGERRWLEQVYAYQLILHQGWRHLAEYKATPTT